MMYEFNFPDVGEGVHEGTLFEIKAPIGTKVEAGDILAVVETDKVVAEIPSPKDGIITKYGVKEGDVIEVGQVLAYIDIGGDSEVSSAEVVEENANVVGVLDTGDGKVLPSSGEGLSDTSTTPETNVTSSKVKATPLARKIAKESGVEISKVNGTGPSGRVTKRDILAYDSRGVEPKIPVEKNDIKTETLVDKVEKLSRLRETIAANMTTSSLIPTSTLHEEINIDQLVKIRKTLNEGRESRISYLPFIVKAITVAIKKFPSFNATFNPETREVTYFSSINVGVAVDGEKGLYVPVVRSSENKNIETISSEIKNYAQKVKDNTITLTEMREGTITVSNYGVSGGIFANPLIMPPQVAIIGLGRIHQKPVVVNGEIVPGTVLPVSIVIDHRVIDGAPAGSFVSYLKELLENPYKLLVNMA